MLAQTFIAFYREQNYVIRLKLPQRSQLMLFTSNKSLLISNFTTNSLHILFIANIFDDNHRILTLV